MIDVALAALAPILWGTTYVVTTQFLPGFDPFLSAAFRALPAGLILTAVGGVLPRGVWWWRSLVLGTLNTGLFFALLFVAAYRLPGGVITTVGAIQPIVVLLFSWLLYGQRPAPVALVASCVGVVGVGLLVLGPGSNWDALGVLSSIAAAISMAVGVVLTKRWPRPVSLVAFTGWQLVAGGTVVAAIAAIGLPALPPVTARNVLGLAWLALLNTGVAYLLWFRGIERIPKTWHVSVLVLLSPIVAVVAGFIVLGQRFSVVQLMGMAIVLASVVAAQRVAASSPRTRRSQAACLPAAGVE